MKRIKKVIISLPEVKKINYLKTRQIGQKIWVDVEVCVKGEKTLSEANAVSREIRTTLMRRIHYIGNVQVSLRPMSRVSS